jgi:acyl-CoA thioester hydrolase
MQAGLDIHGSGPIGLCAESHCRFLAPLVFPETVEAALRVDRLGQSSVRYAIGLFSETKADAAAEGWFVHVFVDRVSRRPVLIEGAMRAALEALLTLPTEEPRP